MCFEKVYLITLSILPSIHLAGSLQISDTIYWYNVNRGKICSKIVGHAAITSYRVQLWKYTLQSHIKSI